MPCELQRRIQPLYVQGQPPRRVLGQEDLTGKQQGGDQTMTQDAHLVAVVVSAVHS
jgi:hypothetical protein